MKVIKKELHESKKVREAREGGWEKGRHKECYTT
jgi:hypothetical protein